MSLEQTLNDRGKTHGSFTENARTSQHLKAVMRKSPNWDELSQIQKEGLEVIAAKLSRILSGNPNEPDHWHDIQGYARLVEQSLPIPPYPGQVIETKHEELPKDFTITKR